MKNRSNFVPGVYGDTIYSGPPERPEPKREDPALDRIGYHELLRSRSWTDADFNRAKGYAFPAPIGHITSGANAGQTVYSRRKIAQWSQELKQFASTL